MPSFFLLRSFLLLLVSVLIITGCGPRWYYHHLDWMIPWYIDDYLTLDSRQSSNLGKRLASQLDWHCRTQLPEYAAFLRSVARDFEDPDRDVPRERLAHHLSTLRGYWKDLMATIGPDAADILVTASDTQIDELFDNLEKDNQELEQKFVDPPEDELLEKRVERMVERLGRWVDDLNDPQRAAVNQWALELGFTSDQWIAQRRHTQLAFRELLNRRATDPDFKAQFIDLLISPETLRTEVYQARLNRNIDSTLNLLERVGKTMDPNQRAHFLARLESLAQDFDVLACELPAQNPQQSP